MRIGFQVMIVVLRRVKALSTPTRPSRPSPSPGEGSGRASPIRPRSVPGRGIARPWHESAEVDVAAACSIPSSSPVTAQPATKP